MRVHLGRPLSGLWLDHEVPALSIETTETLNGPGSISITVPSDYPRRKATDGRTFIHEWGAVLVVEDDADRIIQVGLVDQVTPGATTTTVEAGGISMVLTGCPYKGQARSLIETSVVTVAKYLVADYLGYEAGSLPLTVTGSVPGVTVGVDASAAWKKADAANRSAEKQYTDAKTRYANAQNTVKSHWARIFHLAGKSTIGKIRKGKTEPKNLREDEKREQLWLDTSGAGSSSINGVIKRWNPKMKKWVGSSAASDEYDTWVISKSGVPLFKTTMDAMKTAFDKTKDALSKVDEQAAQPFLLNWWDTQDMSSVLGDLVTAGAEWTESAAWDGQDLTHQLVFRKPSQVRRENLRFEIGVNIQEEPEWAIGDPYTGVFVLGAGEGSKTVHESASWDAGGRVRRVKVVSDQDQKTTARVQALAAKELAKIKKSTGAQVTGITVTDHPFAHWNQYDVGDLIRVIGTMPGGWDIDAWLRITERTMTGSTDKVKLTLEATDD